jgi:hypothetical protein
MARTRNWATMAPELRKWGNRNVEALRRLGDYDVDDWLGTIGLRRRTSRAAMAATATGLILGGAVLGLAAGFFLAPRSGRELRRNLRDRGWKPLSREARGTSVEAQSISSTNLS